MQFDRLRSSNKMLNRKYPFIRLPIFQIKLPDFHFLLITLCDCLSQIFEFCSHIKIVFNLRYIMPFLAASQNYEKLCHVCLPSARLSARREYLGFQWTDFHENFYLRIFWKTLVKIKVSIKLTKIKSILYKNLCMLMEPSRCISRSKTYVSGNVEKNQNSLYLINFFFLNRAAAR
jgi:hypothetical protein